MNGYHQNRDRSSSDLKSGSTESATVPTHLVDERARKLRTAGRLIPNLLEGHHAAARVAASFDPERVRDAGKRLFAAVGTDLSADGCAELLEAAGIPQYCVGALLHAAGGGPDDLVPVAAICAAWELVEVAPTLEAALIALLLCQSSGSGAALRPQDVRPLVEYVLCTHPGLDFLSEADKAFSARYIDTVLARLFYDSNHTGTKLVTAADLQRVEFVQTLWQLEETDDINEVRRLWSYEHFYVLYTTFWKLDDPDHKLMLGKNALIQCVLSAPGAAHSFITTNSRPRFY